MGWHLGRTSSWKDMEHSSRWPSTKRAAWWKLRPREAEVDEMIDLPFAEFNRRVARSGFSPGQRVFGRPTSTPFKFASGRLHRPHTRSRKTPATRCGGARSCGWQLPTDASSPPIAERCPRQHTVDVENHSGHWWLESPSSSTDGRTDPQGWCGPGVCVLRGEPKPGRNETVWGHMRNCLHSGKQRSCCLAASSATQQFLAGLPQIFVIAHDCQSLHWAPPRELSTLQVEVPRGTHHRVRPFLSVPSPHLRWLSFKISTHSPFTIPCV